MEQCDCVSVLLLVVIIADKIVEVSGCFRIWQRPFNCRRNMISLKYSTFIFHSGCNCINVPRYFYRCCTHNFDRQLS